MSEVTAESFLIEAVEMGIPRQEFRTCCGMSPEACKVLWRSINLNDKEPKHVVWTLLFLKCYHRQAEAALAHVSETTEEHYQDCIWETIERINHVYPSIAACAGHEDVNARVTTWSVFPISAFRHDGFSYVKCFNAVTVCELINSLLDEANEQDDIED
jgi:hypothetical protein